MAEPQTDGVAFCTVAAKNYLSSARVLMSSLRAHHPGATAFFLLVDEPDGYFDPAREPFPVLRLADLDLPRPREFCFRYDVMELSTAVRPFLLRRLLGRGYRKLVYLDPDVRLYGPLEEATALLDTKPLLLTPHITECGSDAELPLERDLLLKGAYNMGFLALSNVPQVLRFVDWWADRCEEHSRNDPAHGLFVDQKWMDLAPGMIDGVHLLRHPGYNVAYWNLRQRRITGPPEAPLANGQPVRFVHFSGFEPARPHVLSRYDTAPPGEPVATIARHYLRELAASGYRESSRWPYSHGHFDDGHAVSREMRALFREQPAGRFPDPFRVDAPDSFVRWAVSAASERLAPLAERLAESWPSGAAATTLRGRAAAILGRLADRLRNHDGERLDLAPLAATILDGRQDLQRSFRGANGFDEQGFLSWLAREGFRQYHLKRSWCLAWQAGTDAENQGVMPRILAAYDARPELQRQFPQAFVEEHDAAAFLEWVRSHAAAIGLGDDDRAAFEQLVAETPARRIRDIYLQRPDVAMAFPGALVQPDDEQFPAWLRYSGRREYDLTPDAIAWFVRARSQHVCLAVQRAHRERPEWSQRHPAPLTVFGRGRLLTWLRSIRAAELGPAPEAVTHLCPAEPRSPIDELRLLHAHEPGLADRFPRAFESTRDTDGLLAWAQERAGTEVGLTPGWAEALAHDVRALGWTGLGVSVAGLLRTGSGLGELARATVRALDAVDHPWFTEILDDETGPQSDLTIPDRPAPGPVDFTIVHLNADQALQLRHRLGLAGRGGHRIGYWAWELETIPPAWADAFELFDEIWTCSRYTAAALSAVAPIPVQTLWPAVAVTPSMLTRQELGLDPGAFCFLFMYSAPSVTERKNPRGVIAAFRAAFRRDERVHLVLKVDSTPPLAAETADVLALTEGLPVTIIERPLSRPDVWALMKACDAYVSLHRAEGFGLPLAEAMLLGKPVVATYFSGNVDFMTPWNSFPVPFTLVELERDHGPYRKGGIWAEPDVAAAAAQMRAVYERRDDARQVAERGHADVLRMLSPTACGRRIVERLRAIQRARLRRTPA